MLHASVVVPILYLLVPIVATVVAMIPTRGRRIGNTLRELFVTAVAGGLGGLILTTVYMRSFTGVVPFWQIAVTCYWGISIACLVRGFNVLLVGGLGRVMPRGADGRPCCPASEIAASVFRAMILLGFGIPYIAAMVVIYHPHMLYDGTPMTVLKASYEDIRFTAVDGLHLHGWWIPARAPTADQADAGPDWGRRTVILCHGFNGDKASDLGMVRDLAPNGFNILVFDFRAHGESDGQLTTYGDLERRDVLGAVRWLRQNHADESRKIFGLGEGLGAAALIAAASDPNEGQAFNAIAVFAPYDVLPGLVNDIADEHFMPQAGWLATHLALPIAGAQLHTDLSRFAPMCYVDKIAPRPILVIATDSDDSVEIWRSQTLYAEASQPKYAYWIKPPALESAAALPATDDGHDRMLLKNEKASKSVRVFFETAREIL